MVVAKSVVSARLARFAPRAVAVPLLAALAVACSAAPDASTGAGQGGPGGGTTTSGGSGGSAGQEPGTGASPTPGADGGTSPTAPGSGGVPAPTDKRVVAYFTAWGVYARNYQVADIPADKITHVNYAFANVSDAGECVLGDSFADTDKAFPGDTWDQGAKRGNFHQLEILKQKHPRLQTLISVGGWTWSGKLSTVAATAASRARFASSCVAFAKQYGFDGIDIDWEYPVGGGLATNAYSPADKQNYTLLLAEIRAQLDALGDGKHHLLTIAAPAGPAIMDHLEMGAMARYLDWFNVMTYDFHGGFEATTGFNAPLFAPRGDTTRFDASEAIAGYMQAGVPAAKLTMGVPFYGRGWSGVGGASNGYGLAATGIPTGSWEAGVFDYKDLAKNYVGKGDFTRYWDDTAKVPWLYSPSKQVMISYDDAQSIGLKADYIKGQSLGGAMFWELSGDEGELLDALNAHLR